MTKPLFEASFTNLDLSEFDSPSASSSSFTTSTTQYPSAAAAAAATTTTDTASTTIISASQQLLQTKQKEAIQKQYDLEQEELIQTKAKQRLEEQLQKISKNDGDDDGDGDRKRITLSTTPKECTNGSQLMYNTLLSMHDNDLNGKQLEKRSGHRGSNNNSAIRSMSGLGRRKDQNSRRAGKVFSSNKSSITSRTSSLKSNMKSGMSKKRRDTKHSYRKKT